MDKTKKISYQSLKEKLSDNQLKLIIAGSGSGTCAFASEWYIHWQTGEEVKDVICGLSRWEVESMVGSCYGCSWCCDMCSAASWYTCD